MLFTQALGKQNHRARSTPPREREGESLLPYKIGLTSRSPHPHSQKTHANSDGNGSFSPCRVTTVAFFGRKRRRRAWPDRQDALTGRRITTRTCSRHAHALQMQQSGDKSRVLDGNSPAKRAPRKHTLRPHPPPYLELRSKCSVRAISTVFRCCCCRRSPPTQHDTCAVKQLTGEPL